MIFKYPDEILDSPSISASKNLSSSDLKNLIDEMDENCWSVNGLGIAGVQIGKPYAVFSMLHPKKKKYSHFIDPEVISMSGNEVYREGCLSIPGYFWNVKRPSKIKISYLDINNVKRIKTFDGIFSRIIQHELDHIDGLLLPDHLSYPDWKYFTAYYSENRSSYEYDSPDIAVE